MLFLIKGLSIIRMEIRLIIHKVPNAGKGLLNKLSELRRFDDIFNISFNDR